MQDILKRIHLPKPLQQTVRIAKILNNDMDRCDLFKHATAMAYVTLFSLVPSLAAVFAVIGVFKPFMGESSALYVQAKEFVLSNLAAGSGEQLMEHLEGFISNLNLAQIGLTGFAGMIITLILLLRQIELALNRIWLVKKPRHVVIRFIYFWSFLTLGTFIGGLTIGIVSGFDLSRLNPFGQHLPVHRGFLSHLTPFLAIFTFLTLLYKVVPNCYVAFKHAFFGALPAAILWTMAGKSYGWYATKFTNYQAIYGALAAIPLFLFWLYVLWLITLFGALLSWRSQQTFHLADAIDEEKPDVSAEEKFRNHRLQTIIPYLALLAIYHRFSKAEGKGVTGHEIALKLNIPGIWIDEALEVLVDMKYVVCSQKEAPLQTDNMQFEYFPAYPAESLTLSQLRQGFVGASKHWLNEWSHEWPLDLKLAVETLWTNEEAATPKSSLAEVLKSLPSLRSPA